MFQNSRTITEKCTLGSKREPSLKLKKENVYLKLKYARAHWSTPLSM